LLEFEKREGSVERGDQSNMADTQQLAGVLSACMSPDAVMRHGAEEMLKQVGAWVSVCCVYGVVIHARNVWMFVQIVQQAGGVVLLLQATHSESLSVDLRQLSAIHLKNAVKRGWGEKGVFVCCWFLFFLFFEII